MIVTLTDSQPEYTVNGGANPLTINITENDYWAWGEHSGGTGGNGTVVSNSAWIPEFDSIFDQDNAVIFSDRQLERNGANTIEARFDVSVFDGAVLRPFNTLSTSFARKSFSFSFIPDTGEISWLKSGEAVGHVDKSNAGIGYSISVTTNASYTERVVTVNVIFMASAGRTLTSSAGVTVTSGEAVTGETLGISVVASEAANVGITQEFDAGMQLKLVVLETF